MKSSEESTTLANSIASTEKKAVEKNYRGQEPKHEDYWIRIRTLSLDR